MCRVRVIECLRVEFYKWRGGWLLHLKQCKQWWLKEFWLQMEGVPLQVSWYLKSILTFYIQVYIWFKFGFLNATRFMISIKTVPQFSPVLQNQPKGSHHLLCDCLQHYGIAALSQLQVPRLTPLLELLTVGCLACSCSVHVGFHWLLWFLPKTCR